MDSTYLSCRSVADGEPADRPAATGALARASRGPLVWAKSAAELLAARLRDELRQATPFVIRVERKRLTRAPSWYRERASMSRLRTSAEERAGYPVACATKRSPLCRASGHAGALQAAKEQNVRRAAELINGVRIEPGGVFSYHHVVGRPSIRRGFAPGPELREGLLSAGVGGGACQVSNMLYQLGLLAGLEVVERHRHGIDLFADAGRTVPFGCGATVFYNMADLRLRNPYAFPLVWRLNIASGELLGALLAPRRLPRRITVEERDHEFNRDEFGRWTRSNRILRIFEASGSFAASREEVAHNVARAAYEPSTASLDAACRWLSSDAVAWEPARDRLCARSRRGRAIHTDPHAE